MSIILSLDGDRMLTSNKKPSECKFLSLSVTMNKLSSALTMLQSTKSSYSALKKKK
jgi:hypothetical protein